MKLVRLRLTAAPCDSRFPYLPINQNLLTRAQPIAADPIVLVLGLVVLQCRYIWGFDYQLVHRKLALQNRQSRRECCKMLK